MTSASCARARLVDLHFSLRIAPGEEREMRAHLDACEACRARYQRQLVLARLDPRAPSVQTRLGRALGLAIRKPARRWYALAVAAAGVAALALWPRPDSGFTARGAAAAPPQVIVYRMHAGAAEPAGRSIAPSDELAFAYRNPAHRKFILVFGVDEHQHVYWYHPAWTDPAQDPVAVPIRDSTDLVELPEAIAHPLDGERLTVHALLLDAPLRVQEVEARLARDESPLVAGAEDQTLDLEVKR